MKGSVGRLALPPYDGHRTIERRQLAYHQIIASRLTELDVDRPARFWTSGRRTRASTHNGSGITAACSPNP